jgi:VanZ family protein
LTVLALYGALYAALIVSVQRPEEKLHFIEYGVLAGLIHAALVTRRERLKGLTEWSLAAMVWPGVITLLLTAALGWGDEGIQAILPNRFYDLRDVGLNVVGAVIAVAASTSWRWAQARTA